MVITNAEKSKLFVQYNFILFTFNANHVLFLYLSFLVGRGAQEWAVRHGIPPCPSEKMATSEQQLSKRYVVRQKILRKV